ncbi:uncharacterized protein LOC141849736 [Brevipalpus obovatus]|uniref:uncharacterized protein LOC141849736 n=1 Tax=Brevipalpus obovatus TaxID=246614 RepID=UPI003D9DB1AA
MFLTRVGPILFFLLVPVHQKSIGCPQNLPKSCVCYSKLDESRKESSSVESSENFRIECLSSNLENFPNFIPPTIEEVDLSRNNLKKLSPIENLESLKNLSLSRNHIYSIEPRSFDNVISLAILDLSHNSFRILPSTIFAPLKDLKKLDLSYNQLDYLLSDFFKTQTQLISLNLEGNKLHNLPVDIFDNLERLEILDLARNQLNSLPNSILIENLALHYLDLSWNQFTQIPTSIIQDARNLRSLVFDGNPIRKLDRTSFSKMANLTGLSVSESSRMVSIGNNTFSNLCSLQVLRIIGNIRLTTIHPEAFSGLHRSPHCSNLKKIFLTDNSLRTLKEGILPRAKYDEIDLALNPWNCDCDLAWIRDFPAIMHDDLICNEPKNIAGHNIFDISAEKFVCNEEDGNENMGKVAILGISVTFLFISGLLIGAFLQRSEILDWFLGRRKCKGSIYYVKAPGSINEDRGGIINDV